MAPELRIVGGDVALDLVNTVEPRLPDRTPERDHLGTPEALLAWARRVGLIDVAEAEEVDRSWSAGAGESALADVVRIREAAFTALLSAVDEQAGDPSAALRLLSDRAAGAATRSSLFPDPTRRRPARLEVGTDPRHCVADRLAHAVAALLLQADLEQLKSCPVHDGGCGWLFLDRSRNGSRRWCSMEDCGSKSKARRLTKRRREQRARRTTTPAER